MEFDPILPEARARAMRAQGFWGDELLTDRFDHCVTQRPETTAIVDFNSMQGTINRLSYANLCKLVERIAIGLVEIGVVKNDVVSCQLPNWWQFIALAFACWRIGAVFNPVMPIFREREVKFMLDFSESKVFVIPREFRGFDYLAMMRDVGRDLPRLERLLVLGGNGEESFEHVLLDPPWDEKYDAKRLFAERRRSADDIVELIYTSGTTGEPKGVMHTSNTILSAVRPFCERLGLTSSDIILMSSPLAHQSGFMYGMVLAIFLQTTLVLQDTWNPHRAAELIAEERATYTFASTPFLSDLTDAVGQGGCDASSLRMFLAAGAPIPRVLVKRASKVLGAMILSGWGMTENGAVTTTKPDGQEDKTFFTDGIAIPGMEVGIFASDGKPLPPGEEGLLKTRGCSNFVGYLKRPQLYGHDADGWFDTGDLACKDRDGYIRITGRAKDIIIRGGENIPVVEIEGLLFRHPAIQSVAIVGMPDPRLGERACAFVVLKRGQQFSFEDMTQFLTDQKVAREYFPERLEVLPELPVTPSGKVQKFKLREIAKSLAI